jgi:MFS family permease
VIALFGSSVRSLYVYQALSYSFFDRAIFTIFLFQQGVSLAQIGLLQGLLWVSTFVAEVPMGILGDRIGRKPLVIGGRLCIVGYSVLMLTGDQFWSFAIGFALFGLGEAAISGADVSLLYENARKEGHTGEFDRISGRFRGIASIALAAAMLAGGFLQVISWSWVFGAAIVFHLAGILILSTVRDVREVADERLTFRGQAKELSAAFKADKNLVAFVLGAGLVGASFTTLFIYAPVLLKENDFASPVISVAMTAATGLGALASLLAWRVVRRLGDPLFFWLTPIACAVLMFAIAGTAGVVLALLVLVLAFVHDLIDPIASRVLNDRVADSIRASTLSLYSVSFSAFAVILFPLAGWIADAVSFGAMTAVLGALCLPCAVLLSRGTVLPMAVTAANEDAVPGQETPK